MMDRKLCRDCRWYSGTGVPYCMHTRAASLVDGVNIATSTMRASAEESNRWESRYYAPHIDLANLCGPEGRWYERPNRLLRMAVAPWMYFWYGVGVTWALWMIFG